MRTLIYIAVLILTAFPTYADDKSSDLASIEKAVFDYFHGQGQASEERLFRAFAADNASMVGVLKNKDGEEFIRSWKDMKEVLTNWASNDNPVGDTRDGEILDVSIIDGRIATVIFRSTDRFYDALTLAKVDGDWKIIAKAFILQ